MDTRGTRATILGPLRNLSHTATVKDIKHEHKACAAPGFQVRPLETIFDQTPTSCKCHISSAQQPKWATRHSELNRVAWSWLEAEG